MGTMQLKSEIQKILNKIENEQLLHAVYDFLKQGQTKAEGQIWKTLTEEQKKEVYLSYEESEDNTKLVDWNDLKKKF